MRLRSKLKSRARHRWPTVGFPSVVLAFKGYTKADLFASYERGLGERVVLVLFGGAENIFDEEYFENGFRAPGAVGRGGLSFRF